MNIKEFRRIKVEALKRASQWRNDPNSDHSEGYKGLLDYWVAEVAYEEGGRVNQEGDDREQEG